MLQSAYSENSYCTLPLWG